MEKSTRTGIGALIQTAQKHNLAYYYAPNSVMNKALEVFPDRLPDSTYLPYSQYLAIGDGAMTATNTEGGDVELWPIPHEPRHTGLYKQLPWVIRAINKDLSVAERARFRMRKIIDIGGVKYVAYYLRKMDFSKTKASLEYRVIKDGVVTTSPWEPQPSDQFPPRPKVNPGQVYVTGDDYIAATAKSRVELSIWDISELVNVSNILKGVNKLMTITEMAVCSGKDETVPGDFNGQIVNYTEAIGVQITDFLSTLLPPAFNRNGAALNLDTGSTEPLLALRTQTPGP